VMVADQSFLPPARGRSRELGLSSMVPVQNLDDEPDF
jgi:hypothetical protein